MLVKITTALLFYLCLLVLLFYLHRHGQKNLAGLRSYPDNVQQAVRAYKHIGTFLRGIPLFAVVAVITAIIVTVIKLK